MNFVKDQSCTAASVLRHAKCAGWPGADELSAWQQWLPLDPQLHRLCSLCHRHAAVSKTSQ